MRRRRALSSWSTLPSRPTSPTSSFSAACAGWARKKPLILQYREALRSRASVPPQVLGRSDSRRPEPQSRRLCRVRGSRGAASRAKLAVQPLALHQRNLNVFFSKNANDTKRPRSDDHDDNAHGMRPKQPRPSNAPVEADATGAPLTQVCDSVSPRALPSAGSCFTARRRPAAWPAVPDSRRCELDTLRGRTSIRRDGSRDGSHISSFSGYKSLRLKQSARGAFCFVEFESLPQALIAEDGGPGLPAGQSTRPRHAAPPPRVRESARQSAPTPVAGLHGGGDASLTRATRRIMGAVTPRGEFTSTILSI